MFNMILTLLVLTSIVILIMAIRNAYRVKSAINRIKNRKSFYFIIINISAAFLILALLISFYISAVHGNSQYTYIIASAIFLLSASFMYIASIVTFQMGRLLEKLDKVRKLDPLTQIYNRSQIVKQIKNEFKKYQRYQRPATIAIIDINKFKQVNDNYGHLIGDQVILDLVKTVHKNIRQPDWFGRFGGDEFLLILPETNLSRAKLLTDRLENIIKNKKLMVNNQVIQYSLAIGLAELNSQYKNYESWIHQADKKLLNIKHNLYANSSF